MVEVYKVSIMPRLGLGRQTDEAVMITAANGQTIRVLVSEIRAGRGRGHSVQLLFEAEASVAIDRQEIYDQKQAAKKAG